MFNKSAITVCIGKLRINLYCHAVIRHCSLVISQLILLGLFPDLLRARFVTAKVFASVDLVLIERLVMLALFDYI